PILRRGLALNPEDRWPSCRAFVNELLTVDPDSMVHFAVNASASKSSSSALRPSEKRPTPGNGFPADTSAAADFATVSSTARPQRIADTDPSPQPGNRGASDWRATAPSRDIAQPERSEPSISALGLGLADWWQAYRVVFIV